MTEKQFKPLDLVHLVPVEGPTREDIEAEFAMPLTDSLFCGEFIVESNKARQNILYTSAEINRPDSVPPLPPEEPLG
jgi:hypothetical protein